MLNAFRHYREMMQPWHSTVYYPKGSFETNGRFPDDFNGGFHTLASLYAAAGDTAGIGGASGTCWRVISGIILNLARVLNNHMNILGYLYQYGHRDKVPAVATMAYQPIPGIILRKPCCEMRLYGRVIFHICLL